LHRVLTSLSKHADRPANNGVTMVISSCAHRYAVVAVAGFAALSLAACGSSSTPSASSSSASKPAASSASPPSSTPTPGAAGGNAKDRARGLVGTVSGGTVTVTGPDGPATIDVTPSTKVTQLTAGQLTDVTAGECLLVHPTKDSGAPPTVTAAAVLFGAPDNGQCRLPGNGPGHGLGGTVASVNGNSIVLTTGDNSQTTVTVTPNTHYAKRAAADASVIAAGQCLAARGQKDNSGTLQATNVSVRPANNGRCGGGHPGG
jgi:hypothetical protein